MSNITKSESNSTAAARTTINDLNDDEIALIMQEFISYTEPQYDWYTHRSLHYGRRALIMGVCRRWYNITIGFSQFWTVFAIGSEWGDEKEVNVGTPSRFSLETWLERSQSSLINLHLHLSDWSHSGTCVNHVLATLAQSIYRWGLLELTLDQQAAPLFLSLNRDHSYMLKEIRICTACSPPTNNSVLKALGNWPALQTLVWTLHSSAYSATPHPTFHDVIADFPWARMRNVSLEVTWTLNEFHAFFRCCTMAVSIRLQLQEHPNGPDNPHRPLGSIKLERLRGLAIQLSACFYNYMQYLDLPNLDWISISQRSSTWGTGWPIPDCEGPNAGFQRFIQMTLCSAKAIFIHNYCFTDEEAIRLFSNHHLSRVAVLEIQVGKEALPHAIAAIENANSIHPSTAVHYKIQDTTLAWCRDQTLCDNVCNKVSTFHFTPHSWMHLSSLA